MKSLLVKMDDLQFNGDLFRPMKTRRMVDRLFSSEGGIMPGTNLVVTGDPGVGKSTVLLDILADLQKEGKKVLFISGEMNAIDMYGYVKRFPKFGKLPILFLGDHVDNNPQQVIENVLQEGFDVVLIDSWAEVTEVVADGAPGYASKKKIDNWMLNLMETHNKGLNKGENNTSFLVIQQVNKDGSFAGSNRIKHMTTGMFHIRFNKEGGRYMYFSKNRRGGESNKFFFSLAGQNQVMWTHTESLNSNDE